MQQAYYSEANKFGAWNLIGYTAPGAPSATGAADGTTNNFEYKPTALPNAGDTSSTDQQDVWHATNLKKLNDCAPNANWQINAKTETGRDFYETTIVDKINCEPLTPTFESIGAGTGKATTAGGNS